ncbi:MAG: lysylphosphatidylglycerol synthase transmembrane domain-containing protein [Thermomicrobiales bacterium]
MNRRRIILGFAVSAFFLVFALRGQDYAAIKEAFSQVTYWYLVPALGLYFIGLLVRAYRWSVLLRPVEAVPARKLVGINAVGLMANNVMPLRTGESVRAYALSQRTSVTSRPRSPLLRSSASSTAWRCSHSLRRPCSSSISPVN